MYNFELNELQKQNMQYEVLKMVETLSEEFCLQDHFGRISIVMDEIVEQIQSFSKGEFYDTSFNFFVNADSLSIQIHHSESLAAFKTLLQEENEENNAFLTISKLTDKIEFDSEDRDMNILFHVKPNMKRANYQEERVGETITEKQKSSKNI
jgi:hypothetical protein